MAAKKEKQLSPIELLNEMKSKGIEQQILGTNRIVRLRTLDAPTLLRQGKLPDILTPLVVRSVYEELPDKELREFLGHQRGSVEDALKHIEALDFVASQSIADGTKVEDLTLAEKRWIFRLAMGPAELLITFRYDPNDDVELVAEVEDVQPPTE